MNYLVSGADRATGKELTLSFEARSAAEAESIASLSMLVAEVQTGQPATEPVSYATPEAAGGATQVNWAAGIAFHAKLLRLLSIILALMALFPIGSYFWDIGESVQYVTSYPTFRGALNLLERAATSDRLIFAITLIVGAVLLRLAAHVALAIRELATRPK